jgi:hypothetical protein
MGRGVEGRVWVRLSPSILLHLTPLSSSTMKCQSPGKASSPVVRTHPVVEVVAQDKYDKSEKVISVTKAAQHISRFTDWSFPKARVRLLKGDTVSTDTYLFFRRFSDN